MRHKKLATGPPDITEDVFEDFLATDDLLVEYFNEFLSLPTFTEAIKFNKILGIFEVVNNVPESLKQHIKKVLREHQPPNPIFDVTRSVTGHRPKEPSASDLNVNNNYSTMCLNREQGVQWIKKERLPAFLKSDCYFEYRLAKLLSQVKLSNACKALNFDSHYHPWTHKKEIPPSPPPETANQGIMQKFFVTLGQASFSQTKDWFTIAKQSEQTSTTVSLSRPIAWGSSENSTLLHSTQTSSHDVHAEPSISLFPQRSGSESLEKSSGSTTDDDEYSVSIADSPLLSPVRLYIEHKVESRNKAETDKKEDATEMDQSQNVPIFHTLEEFAQFYIDRIMISAIKKLTGQPVEKMDDIYALSQVSIQNLHSPRTLSSSSNSSDMTTDDENINLESDSDGQDSIELWHTKGTNDHINSRKQFERFKLFLKGTSGEKLWWLWLDIERLKVITDIKRQQSHLKKMKKLYLVTSEDHFIKSEVLQRLRLLDINHWNVDFLQQVQAEIVKSLLLYWAPRFCLADTAHIGAHMKLMSSRQLKPKRDADPFAHTTTLLPLRPKSCMPKICTSVPPLIESSPPVRSSRRIKTGSPYRQPSSLISVKFVPQKTSRKSLSSSAVNTLDDSIKRTRNASAASNISSVATDLAKSVEAKPDHDDSKEDILTIEAGLSSSVMKNYVMEVMLQALHLDCRAGYFFAHFCEQSGNQLWENSVYFWFDLQSYHHLFYQDTLQPFKLYRQSQFLFGTYLAPSASMDIGVDQIIKKEIYQKLDPPFEDLFDAAEEYILALLLSAWIEMTESDRKAYGKVELVEESRQLESVYYRHLQALQQEKASKKEEEETCKSIFLPPPETPKEPNLWEQVPDEYKNYNLGHLIRHRMEMEHFRTFLEANFASMDLMCWIDLEHFRRMPHKEKEKRQEKSKDIKNKYLNKKYFFGPNSPATREQQEQIMQLAGGWGKLLHDRLSSNVLVEIQKYVRMRIEKKWLPMFLATEEYRERQKAKAQMKDVAEDVVFQTGKKKMGVWKHLDSKWISSSKEIIAFRKALSNPVTASQFQRFISLKGDYLENGLLFWQEVQKYKDLCHSHCDEFTIQNKITAIINCFINSSIPPALQIDIPPEQAEKIMEKRRDLGPYVFREAQMTVFSVMFKFWPEFAEFRTKLTDEKIIPFLERKKVKKMEQLKRKMREEERLAEQQQEDSKRIGGMFDFFGDNENESAYSEEIYPRAGEMFPGTYSGKMFSGTRGGKISLGSRGVENLSSTHGKEKFSGTHNGEIFSGTRGRQKFSGAHTGGVNFATQSEEKFSRINGRKKHSGTYIEEMFSGTRAGEKLSRTQGGEMYSETLGGDILPVAYDGEEYSDAGSEFSGQDEYGRSRNVSWSYSKYVEALEQERLLLKMQEELEKKSTSSMSSDNSSLYTIKSETSKRTGKSFISNQSAKIERVSSALRQ
ncbi:regulator of G-protein signaling 22 [Discoglossus pictus]